jgi:hypothetical protein
MTKRRFICEPCDRCDGLGFHKACGGEEFHCYKCKGTKTKRREIHPVTDYFSKGHSVLYESFSCDSCDEDYHLADTCKVETGQYDDDLFECECGRLLEVSGEWESYYCMNSREYDGVINVVEDN